MSINILETDAGNRYLKYKKNIANSTRVIVNSIIELLVFDPVSLCSKENTTHLISLTMLLVNAIRITVFATTDFDGYYHTHITVPQTIKTSSSIKLFYPPLFTRNDSLPPWINLTALAFYIYEPLQEGGRYRFF